MNVRTRVEKLEAVANVDDVMPCVVTHFPSGDCEEAKQQAIERFTKTYGRAPTKFMNIHIVGMDKKKLCSCPEDEPTESTQ